MANRKRNIQMKFYVTEDEKRLIDEKMSQLPTRRYGAYLRKMAIDGYIIYTDTADIKAFISDRVDCPPIRLSCFGIISVSVRQFSPVSFLP